MSEMAKTCRAQLKAKAHRLANQGSSKVDASSWSAEDPISSGQTGKAPTARRAFKSGGMVSGEDAPKNLSRKSRAPGGGTGTILAPAQSPMPKPRPKTTVDIDTHEPDYAKGGEVSGKKQSAYHVVNKKTGEVVAKASSLPRARNIRDKHDMEYGGYQHRVIDTSNGESVGYKSGGSAEHGDSCKCAKCSGGRVKRASGGRAKGKLNVNININTKPEADLPALPPIPMGGLPPMPAAPVAPPAGMPPMGGGVGAPPGLGAGTGLPPLPRKDGGKVYPKMTKGAGSGEGRLEKIKKYGH